MIKIIKCGGQPLTAIRPMWSKATLSFKRNNYVSKNSVSRHYLHDSYKDDFR